MIVDDHDRPLVTENDLERIRAALTAIPEGKHGALLVIADAHGARGQLAVNVGTLFKAQWKVGAGFGVPVGERPDGYLAIEAVW